MSSTPTLVVVPGLDGTGLLSEPLARAAAGHFEVHTLRYDHEADQSYVGLSQRLQQELPQDRSYVLLAESFGGPLALRLAALAPSGLTAVVLVNSFLRSPMRWPQGTLLSAAAPVLLRPPAWAVRRMLVGEDAPDALVRSVQDALGQVPAAVLRARFATLVGCDESESYLRCMAPMFYLHSRADRLLGERALSLLSYLRPGLVIEPLDAPHLLLQARPDAAVAVLRRWLLEDKSHA
ncbi:MAG TPA: alpha/beta fold hydrolase [Polyangiales bacterium]